MTCTAQRRSAILVRPGLSIGHHSSYVGLHHRVIFDIAPPELFGVVPIDTCNVNEIRSLIERKRKHWCGSHHIFGQAFSINIQGAVGLHQEIGAGWSFGPV